MASPRRKVIFTLPAKTFLVGEYAVLKGGGGIILATDPRFKFTVATKSLTREARWHGFGEKGPGLQYLKAYRTYFRDFDIEFTKPPTAEGGLGASSAEYAGVYLLHRWLRSVDRDPRVEWDMQDMLNEYRSFAWSGKGPPPSGVDVVGQIYGGISYVHPQHLIRRELAWSCPNLGFLLISTGQKVATHQHLQELTSLDVEDMSDCVEIVAGALERADSNMLVGGINDYVELLRFRNLVARPTLDLISEAFRWPGVCAVKGCGALGADVVLVVFERRYQTELLAAVAGAKRSILSADDQLCEGWRLDGYRPVQDDTSS